jgi:hypothetical protein
MAGRKTGGGGGSNGGGGGGDGGGDGQMKKRRSSSRRSKRRTQLMLDAMDPEQAAKVVADEKAREQRVKEEALLLELERTKGKKKPPARLKKIPWRLENGKKETKHVWCESSLFHPRRAPAK